jgi:hypothetical protein
VLQSFSVYANGVVLNVLIMRSPREPLDLCEPTVRSEHHKLIATRRALSASVKERGRVNSRGVGQAVQRLMMVALSS